MELHNDILDAKAQHWLRAKIATLPVNQQIQLKGLRLCMHAPINQIGAPSGVFLLRHSKTHSVKFFGQQTCKNTWACPHCTAIRMNEYRKQIGAAIDALEKEGLVGFMITFTIPHFSFMSCREVTDVLYQCWSDTFRNAFSKRSGKKGEHRWQNKMNKFIVENDIRHYVRCAEYTYGENGWHPHFHAIFFTPAKNLRQIINYQEEIRETWNNSIRRIYQSYWKKHNLHGNMDKNVLIQRLMQYVDYDKAQSLKVSVDSDGNAFKMTSAAYVTGWTSDKEMTGNVRKSASHADHFTPAQILDKAVNGDQKMAELYIEFCLQVTRKPVHHRIRWSLTGIKAVAVRQLQCEEYRKVLKKKSQLDEGKWEFVCFLPKSVWSRLFDSDCHKAPTLSNVLYLAKINRKDLLQEFVYALTGFNVVFEYSHFCAFIERITNAA